MDPEHFNKLVLEFGSAWRNLDSAKSEMNGDAYHIALDQLYETFPIEVIDFVITAFIDSKK